MVVGALLFKEVHAKCNHFYDIAAMSSSPTRVPCRVGGIIHIRCGTPLHIWWIFESTFFSDVNKIHGCFLLNIYESRDTIYSVQPV